MAKVQTMAGLDKKLDLLIQAQEFDKKWREEMKEVLIKHIQQDDRNFNQILSSLMGDGEARLGLVLRLDRLEQTEKKRAIHIKALWVATLTFLGGLGLQYFR